MNLDRRSAIFGNRRLQANPIAVSGDLRGFAITPFSAYVTPAQALLYQAAYQQARQALEAPRWLATPCLN